jgi:hypothetical protein
MKLPTFQEAAERVSKNSSDKPTALDVFIYTQEPAHPRSKLFREGLLAVLKEAMGVK